MFVAVQDSCTYAGTKLCLNDHYLCETFCLGWTLHHCNTTPMWGLISLLVLIEHSSKLSSFAKIYDSLRLQVASIETTSLRNTAIPAMFPLFANSTFLGFYTTRVYTAGHVFFGLRPTLHILVMVIRKTSRYFPDYRMW